MENWDGWLTLLSVVETGTLSGAAAQLRIDATTIGRRLNRLETKLGRRLLERRVGVGHGADGIRAKISLESGFCVHAAGDRPRRRRGRRLYPG